MKADDLRALATAMLKLADDLDAGKVISARSDISVSSEPTSEGRIFERTLLVVPSTYRFTVAADLEFLTTQRGAFRDG